MRTLSIVGEMTPTPERDKRSKLPRPVADLWQATLRGYERAVEKILSAWIPSLIFSGGVAYVSADRWNDERLSDLPLWALRVAGVVALVVLVLLALHSEWRALRRENRRLRDDVHRHADRAESAESALGETIHQAEKRTVELVRHLSNITNGLDVALTLGTDRDIFITETILKPSRDLIARHLRLEHEDESPHVEIGVAQYEQQLEVVMTHAVGPHLEDMIGKGGCYPVRTAEQRHNLQAALEECIQERAHDWFVPDGYLEPAPIGFEDDRRYLIVLADRRLPPWIPDMLAALAGFIDYATRRLPSHQGREGDDGHP